jgi:hypothetical protein
LERDLQKRKICLRFVPHSLTAEQKKHLVECCRNFTKFIDQDGDVVQRIVTGAFNSILKGNDKAWNGVE